MPVSRTIRQDGSDTGQNARVGRPSRMSHAADVERAVDAILRHPSMSPSEIAALVGCADATVSKALDKLAQCAADRGLAGLMTRVLSRMDAIEARLTMLESGAGAATPGTPGAVGVLVGSSATSRMLTLSRLRHGVERPSSGATVDAGKK
jgi:hypothetical protein